MLPWKQVFKRRISDGELIAKTRNLLKRLGEWCRHTDLNRGPSDYKSDALPTELYRHIFKKRPLYTPEHQLNQRRNSLHELFIAAKLETANTLFLRMKT